MLRWPKIGTKMVDLVGFGQQVAAETSVQALGTLFGYRWGRDCLLAAFV